MAPTQYMTVEQISAVLGLVLAGCVLFWLLSIVARATAEGLVDALGWLEQKATGKRRAPADCPQSACRYCKATECPQWQCESCG